jgi:hypothetical protein
MIGMAVPDRTVLEAYGLVSIRHTQLDHILRFTIKTLAGLTVDEALDSTARTGSAELRDRIKKLARKRLGEGRPLELLRSILTRCERLTEQRNRLLHGVIGRELDGDEVMHNADNTWGRLPSVEELHQLAAQIAAITNELNDARLFGFLGEALAAEART